MSITVYFTLQKIKSSSETKHDKTPKFLQIKYGTQDLSVLTRFNYSCVAACAYKTRARCESTE